jgi:hypothetical protein
MSLLKRVSEVRTGKHTRRTAEPARKGNAALRVQESPPPATLVKGQMTASTKKPMKTSKGFGRIDKELTRIAAIKRPLTVEELQRLDELVKETKSLRAEDNHKMFRLLHQRARLLRKSKTPQPKRTKRGPAVPRGVLPAGLVGSRRLSQGGREVLGGLPSSRRGH